MNLFFSGRLFVCLASVSLVVSLPVVVCAQADHPLTPPPSQPPTTPPGQRPSATAPVTAYPLPVLHPQRWRFTLAAPSPAFFQSRDNRPRRTELQFPFALYGGLGEKKGWGKFFLASENVLSTDAFDTSARVGLRIGVEHAIYRTGPLLTTEIGVATNQRAQNQAFGASMGTRFDLPIRVATGKPDLQINFLGYENRRRLNESTSPNHTAKNVLVHSATLSLPPICFGPNDPAKRPNLLFRTRAWFFSHEEAAPGYTPHTFESRYEAALIVPTRAMRKKIPFVRAVAFSYIYGANDANAYAPQRNFRFNFLLVETKQLLAEMTEHKIIPKLPDIKLPTMGKPEDKPEEKPAESPQNPPSGDVKSSTKP